MRTPRFAPLLALLVLFGIGGCIRTPDIARVDLQRDYLAAPADLRPVARTTLHVRDTGPKDAGPVILIHGVGAHLQTWDGWAAGLDDAFRVVRFDLPGSGLSPPDSTDDYTDERSIALLLGLMDDLAIDRAALVGNSLGGRIAWRAVANHPDRFSKLVLVAPDGFANPPFEYGTPPKIPFYFNVLKYVLPRSFLRSSLASAYADPEKLTDTRVDRYYELLRAPGSRAALLTRFRQTVLVPPEPLLAGIRIPTLLLWGEEDRFIPIDNAQAYLDALPDARLVRLPGIGHVPQEEAPQASLIPLRAFLSEP